MEMASSCCTVKRPGVTLKSDGDTVVNASGETSGMRPNGRHKRSGNRIYTFPRIPVRMYGCAKCTGESLKQFHSTCAGELEVGETPRSAGWRNELLELLGEALSSENKTDTIAHRNYTQKSASCFYAVNDG